MIRQPAQRARGRVYRSLGRRRRVIEGVRTDQAVPRRLRRDEAEPQPRDIVDLVRDAGGNLLGGLNNLTTQGGSLAPLPISLLSDGPWCGGGENRFDADLLRVKKVRITLRVQAGQASMRATGSDYAVAGTSKSALKALPDYTIVFEVSPRNMNLGR